MKFCDKFVPLANRTYKANDATFRSTDKVDDYIIIDTGASAGIGNANENYGAHQDINNGPIVEFADGSSKQVTSTDILPISSLPPEACTINKFDSGKTLLAIQHACDSGIDFLFQSKDVTAIHKNGKRTPVGLRHPTLNLSLEVDKKWGFVLVLKMLLV